MKVRVRAAGKKKKLLLAEATLFNYHRVFDIIKKLCKGFNQVEHIQSNLNHPLIRSTKEIEKIKGDCEFDMSPYAAAIIRLFTKNDFKNLNINCAILSKCALNVESKSTRSLTYLW